MRLRKTERVARASSPTPVPGPATAVAGPGQAMLRVARLQKSFGATQALRDCSVDFLPGEVHVILGENGSGKSTLVKILSGVQRPDGGEVVRDGASRPQGFASPRAAAAAGIAAVFQEVLVSEPRSVLDNVWLGTDGVFRDGLSRVERETRARTVLRELLGREPELTKAIEDLALSDRQACCIARALVREPDVLILDEATSALDVATRDRLFALLRGLRERGCVIIFISHRMDEIAEIGDRITVMRSGAVVGSRRRGEASANELVELMTGEQLEAAHRQVVARAPGHETVLRITDLRLSADGEPIQFELKAGELVGLAGLEGHGQDLFLKSAWGAKLCPGRVLRVDAGRETELGSPTAAARAGVAYVPRERRNEALLTHMSIRANFSLPTIGVDTTRGRLSERRSQQRLERYIELLGIRLGDSQNPIETLSGGNQQKVVIARWLAAAPRVLLLNDPTRGVDVGAKRDIYRLLAELTADGVAVMMLSTEVDEHVELMDRVLVFRSGAMAREIPRPQLTRRNLISAFFGTDPTAIDEEEIHAEMA